MARALPKPRRRRGSTLRPTVQLGFLGLTLGFVFLLQANAERFCPFGGVEAIYAYLTEGNVLCSIGVSNFFVLGGVLLTVLLFRRAFCGYACPVGTIQEWTRKAGAALGIPLVRVNPRADWVLSLLKYAAVVIIIVITWRASELLFREVCPAYALLSRHGEDITYWAYVVSGAVLVASLFMNVPFCRWLCPFAAVMNPLSKAAVGRVARDPASCASCGKCDAVCPMAIPVSEVDEVTHARCTACLQCVDSCPKHKGGTHAGRMPPRTRPVPQIAIVTLFLVVVGGAVLASELNPLPSFTFTKGEPPAVTETIELRIEELSCRGRANLLRYFLERDDELALDGYFKFEAWPQPGMARARVTFDPEEIDELLLKDAIAQPYYDEGLQDWRTTPFVIQGYDPLGSP